MIYLDNAATTYPKPKKVLKSVEDCIKKYCGNPGRSSHFFSIKTSERIFEARESVARILGHTRPENVVFTQNATYALNMAIKGCVSFGDHVLISDIEHNSVLRPLVALKKEGVIDFSVYNSFGNIENNIEKEIKPNTRLLISSLSSNVFGRKIPLDILYSVASKYNLILILDASQLLGHEEIDVSGMRGYIVCAPVHKGLFGVQGAGFLCVCEDISLKPILEGGSGNESKNPEMPMYLPERLEAGTLSSPAIISVIEGVKFIEKQGISEINRKMKMISDRYADILRENKHCVVYDYNESLISFNVASKSASEVAYEFNKYGVAVRSGLHCSPLAHKLLGTENIGTVRISFSYFNRPRESDIFFKALKNVTSL